MHRKTHRRLMHAILVASLVTAASPALPLDLGIGRTSIAMAADPSADIPGVSLPGPVSAGRLGGGIYDVVYRFTVPPGHVIIASLTGTAGTDFDIYLFDGSAQTVLSEVGLLKKSTGPTSTESITWSTSVGGTYYIDLNGATDVEGDYRLTLQTVPDSTPPTVSFVLANGRGSINQVTVPVTLTATDDLSGVAEMAFSEDSVTYSEWRPFASPTTWTFGPGDGVRTLWAKVRNGVGLESTPSTARVTIDTDPPAVVGLTPAPGSSVVGLRPAFSVTFDEPIDPATWGNLGLIVQHASGALVPGAYTYDASARLATFIPAGDLQPGLTYVVTVGDVRDVAGNKIPPGGSWTVVPLAPAHLEAVVTPPVIPYGSGAQIDLTLSGAPAPAAVQVSERTSRSGGFVPVGISEVLNGGVVLPVKPSLNTTYRFIYPGAFGVTPAQLDVPILVRRTVSLVGRNSSTIAKAKVGAAVSLVAAALPAEAGTSVSFRVYRFDPARRTWVYAGSRGRSTDAAGRAVYSWTPPSAGSWYVRAVVASTADYANNSSPVYRWTVTR